MRAWKKTRDSADRVFLYFHGHPSKLFTIEHIASQVKVGEIRVREIVAALLARGKLEALETVAARKWGRPRIMYRAIRKGSDSLAQVEIFSGPGREIPATRRLAKSILIGPT